MSNQPDNNRSQASNSEAISAAGGSVLTETAVEEGEVPAVSYDEERLTDMREILEPQKLRLLQQILATEWGSLSARELAYRNPEITESTVRDHLREMATRDRPLVAKLEAETREQNVPWTYYAVTEYAIELLKELGAYEGISVLYQMYEQMERTADIDRIEAFEHRPTPDWL